MSAVFPRPSVLAIVAVGAKSGRNVRHIVSGSWFVEEFIVARDAPAAPAGDSEAEQWATAAATRAATATTAELGGGGGGGNGRMQKQPTVPPDCGPPYGSGSASDGPTSTSSASASLAGLGVGVGVGVGVAADASLGRPAIPSSQCVGCLAASSKLPLGACR